MEEQQQENNEQPFEAQNENEIPKEEEKLEEVPTKIYKPANPTIKECIELNELLPVSNIDKNLNAITTVIYNNDDLLNECVQKIDNRSTIGTDVQIKTSSNVSRTEMVIHTVLLTQTNTILQLMECFHQLN